MKFVFFMKEYSKEARIEIDTGSSVEPIEREIIFQSMKYLYPAHLRQDWMKEILTAIKNKK